MIDKSDIAYFNELIHTCTDTYILKHDEHLYDIGILLQYFSDKYGVDSDTFKYIKELTEKILLLSYPSS